MIGVRDASDNHRPVFVYGTLRDPAVLAFVIEGEVERRLPGTAVGQWQEGTEGLRAVIFRDGNECIEGEVLWFRPESYERAIRRLDQYETQDLYRRIYVKVTVDGDELEAFAYEWTGNGIT